MKILVYGATGRIGTRVVREATQRGHEVHALSRNAAPVDGATVTVQGDVLDAGSVTEHARGLDAIVSAISSGAPTGQNDPRYDIYAEAARSLSAGVRSLAHDAPRVVLVGGAGSLLTADGTRVVDSPDFPARFKQEALAQAAALGLWRNIDDVDWTSVSPAGTIEPGRRTGTYRRGGDELLVDSSGRSFITMEDFAVALVDELERPTASRERITFAY
jgi:putative NADH-flavin reductase